MRRSRDLIIFHLLCLLEWKYHQGTTRVGFWSPLPSLHVVGVHEMFVRRWSSHYWWMRNRPRLNGIRQPLYNTRGLCELGVRPAWGRGGVAPLWSVYST